MKSQKMPFGYWTKERCHKEALKYKTKAEFRQNERRAYDKAKRLKWVDEICSHMTEIRRKPWTKEECQIEALKYKNRKDFQYNSKGCYLSALKRKWINDICGHMTSTGNLHKRCIYSYEFSDNFVYVGLTFNIEKRNHDHLSSKRSPVFIHSSKTGILPLLIQLTDYISVDDAKLKEGEYLEIYKSKKWNILNKSETGAVGGKSKWTKEKCQIEALKYKDKTEFRSMDHGCYLAASKNKWMVEICSHMVPRYKSDGYWTKDKCGEETIKYNKKSEFRKNNQTAYFIINKNKWFDLYSHM